MIMNTYVDEFDAPTRGVADAMAVSQGYKYITNRAGVKSFKVNFLCCTSSLFDSIFGRDKTYWYEIVLYSNGEQQ